jgi:hypothetical protein
MLNFARMGLAAAHRQIQRRRTARQAGRFARRSSRLRGLEPLEPRLVLDAVVVVNEIMYHPAGGDEALTWIELHNQMAVDVDISRWYFDDAIGFTFPNGTIVKGGGYLVVAADPSALNTATGFGNALGPFSGRLSNSDDRIRLYDRGGRLMDEVHYFDREPWPLAADGSGVSLAKRHPDLTSAPPENWTSSVLVGGTPGAANFPDSQAPPEFLELLRLDDAWRYLDTGAAPPVAWHDPAFDAAAWSAGPAGFHAAGGQLGGGQPVLISPVTATPSTQFTSDGRLAVNTVNGAGLFPDGSHSAATNTMWLTSGPSDPSPWIQFDLGTVKSIDQMRVWNYNEYRPDLPTRVLELLGRGVNRVDIQVAGANGVFSTHLSNFALNVVTTATTGTDFSQWVDMGGVSARYVRFNIRSNHNGANFITGASDAFGNYVGLSEVQFYLAGDPRRTELAAGAGTYYFRTEFNFAHEPSLTQLTLRAAIADGAIVYLNGQEVHRQNLPAGSVAHGAAALADVAVATPASVPIGTSALMRGRNVLAVQLHPAATSSMDVAFAAALDAVVLPPELADLQIPLVINETAGTAASEFWVELVNHGTGPLAVGGYALVASTGGEYVLPSRTLAPGEFLVVTEAQLGVRPPSGRLYLYNPSRSLVVDAARLRPEGMARFPDGTGEWMVADSPTPGAANLVTTRHEIVINEIMYHSPALPAVPGQPPTFATTTVLPLDAFWKYDQSGVEPPAAWRQPGFNDAAWPSGRALLYVSGALLPGPKNTPLTLGRMTYYFRTTFDFNGDPAAAELRLRHIIDDGAVFYLNGIEVHRFNMPEGAVNYNTPAASAIATASYSQSFILPAGSLVVGTNTLAVEVHQHSLASSDIVFGADLTMWSQVSPGVPGQPYRESNEEWVELYNRSTSAVDVSGWTLASSGGRSQRNGMDFIFRALRSRREDTWSSRTTPPRCRQSIRALPSSATSPAS